MPLSVRNLNKLQNHIDGLKPACSVCHETAFRAHPQVLMSPAVEPGQSFVKDEDNDVIGMPVVFAICEKCGHVVYFSAQALGFVVNKGTPDDAFFSNLFSDK